MFSLKQSVDLMLNTLLFRKFTEISVGSLAHRTWDGSEYESLLGTLIFMC